MQPEVIIELVDFDPFRDEIRSVRFKVFVEEQKVPAEMEMDEWDARSQHVLIRASGKAIGTGRLLPDGHIGRVAILKAWRGKGLGKKLMEALIKEGKLRGIRCFRLSAQVQALAFYRGMGFNERGAVYLEAGIEHQEMMLEL